jgi:hypothetical protein
VAVQDMQQDQLTFNAVAAEFLQGWKVLGEQVKQANKQVGMIVESYQAAQMNNYAQLQLSRFARRVFRCSVTTG